MNAFELLEKCEQSGVKVELVDHEHITVEPIDQLPSDLLDQLKQHKPDIISYLMQQSRTIAQQPANDAPRYTDLPPRQQRALNGFKLMFEQQCDNLRRKDYSTHSAMVEASEWRCKVMRKLNLDRQQMEQIENALIGKGYLAYSTKKWLIEGNGKITASQISGSNPECLHDGTAKGFYAWLDGNDTIH